MCTYYFEFIRDNTSEYACRVQDSADKRFKYLREMGAAHRVWFDDGDGNITFAKNRLHDRMGKLTSDELEEFFWIKLKAEILN